MTDYNLTVTVQPHQLTLVKHTAEISFTYVGAGGIEIDPVFTASAAADITAADIARWNATASSFAQTTITGTQNGVNKRFTLGRALTAPILIFRNGVKLRSDSYSIASTTLDFNALAVAPKVDDILEAYGV